jgi:RNA polymerase sigma factor (sigma-70 family)
MEFRESIAGSPEHGEEQVLECGDLVVELTNDPAKGEVGANFIRASLMEEHWRESGRSSEAARLPVLPARKCRPARCLRKRARVCDNSGCGAALPFRLRKAAPPGGTNMASEGFPVPQTSTTMLKQIAGASGHPRWTEFVAKYRPMLETYMRTTFPTLEADEVVQETFLGIMRALPDYVADPDRSGAFHNYLTGVLRHKALDALRLAERDTENRRRLAEAAPEPSGDANEEEWRRAVCEIALGQLLADPRFGERSKQIFERTALRGEKPQDVADALLVDRSVVDQTKKRMTERLKALIKGLEDADGI